MKVTLYSTNCSNCRILESKLKEKNIDFELVTDEKVMFNKGFLSAPMLDVDGKIMIFNKALGWVQNI